MSGIGELREGPLHAAVKRWLARPGDVLEAPRGGFVIDLVRGEELIEVQTGGFHRLKPKLAALLDAHPITVVHPVAAERRIVRVDEHGEVVASRRSPLRAGVLHACAELVSLAGTLAHPHLRVDILLCREDHVRGAAPVVRRGRRRDPGERRLVDVLAIESLAGGGDLLAHLPPLEEPFSAADVAAAAGIPAVLARQVVYCLRGTGAIQAAGRRGRAPVYERSGAGHAAEWRVAPA